MKPAEHFIAHTGTMHYGKGASLEEAVRRLKGLAGPSFVAGTGYKVFRCHPDTYCGDDGKFVYPDQGGFEPVEVKSVAPSHSRRRTVETAKPQMNGRRTGPPFQFGGGFNK